MIAVSIICPTSIVNSGHTFVSTLMLMPCVCVCKSIVNFLLKLKPRPYQIIKVIISQPTGCQNITYCSFEVKEFFIIQQCSKKKKKSKNNINIVTRQISACWMVGTLPIVSDSQLFQHLSSQRNVPLDQKPICSTACCSGNTLFLKIVPFSSW